MGRYLFRLPDIGEGIAQAEITAWHVKQGDRVDEDQSIVDVMTDKATVDMSSPVTGVVTALHGGVGDFIAVGSTLIELEVEGAGNAADEGGAPKEVPKAPVVVQPAATEPGPSRTAARQLAPASPAPAVTRRAPGDAPLAAPATRRRAFELGIPLQFVPGTGPNGRITPEDLDAYLAPRMTINERKIIGLRCKIAEKMQASKRRIPHFSYIEEFDLTELEALRKELNEDRTETRPKLTMLPFFMRALVLLQPEFPHINATYDDEAGVLREYEAVHIGIATQTLGGLMVPVVRHAEARDLWDCARELTRVTSAARDGTAAREELTGSTMTLTSLGALGGIAATPVINAPEVAIIGPNKLVDRPVIRDKQIVVRTMMNLSSSFDHRIVDGYDAARFVQRLKRLIERPAHLFLDRP